MDFNRHTKLTGMHSFLSPSNYHWINYDEDKLDRVFLASQAARRGTELHALAHELIRLRVKLPEDNKTLSMYVNDAIGYRMTPEQILFYSENCYGTADCISYTREKLRVHDLKTGVTDASVHQLEVYVALFCLEYGIKPTEIESELRLYQNNEVRVYVPQPMDIVLIMDKIMTFDKRIKYLRAEAS
jgi:hypothetical protein